MAAVICFPALQPQSAKFVLITMPAGIKSQCFFTAAARGKLRAKNIRCAGPHSLEPGASCTDVVIHLPARPQTIPFISLANRIENIAPHYVTEIRQTVERLQRPLPEAKPLDCLFCRTRNLFRAAGCIRKNSLFIPG